MLTTTEIIKKYNLFTKKSLGQNFLVNPDLLTKIVKCAGNLNNFEILEVGTGPAGLTMAILKESPLYLITIDADKRCEDIINNELIPYYNNLKFINFDALKINEKELFKKKYKIISNLPYNVGTVLLFKWLENNINDIENITILLQKEVVDRIIAKNNTKEYGRLSVICQYLCDVKKCFDIQPHAFYPAPNVISTVVNLTPKKNIDLSKLHNLSYICKILFNQRRKTVLNNLKNMLKNNKDSENLNKDISAENILINCNININVRPEELLITDFIKITNYIYN